MRHLLAILLLALLLALLLWQLPRAVTQKPMTAAKLSTQPLPANTKSSDDFTQLYDQIMSAAPGGKPPVPFKTKGRVHLKAGESAVIGFWQMSKDTNGLALVTPELQPDGTMILRARLLQVSDSMAADEAMRGLFPAPFDVEQYGAMSPSALQSALEHLQGAKGVDMMAMPTVLTQPGQQVSIMIGELDAGGTNMKKGINLDLDLGTPAVDGSLDLALGLELR